MEHRRRFSAFIAKECNFGPAIRQSLQFTRDFLSACDLEPRLKVKLAIIVEELVTNALHHGGQTQHTTLSFELSEENGAIRLLMEDNGVAFNPLAVPPIKAPNPQTGGGIGLAIVQAWAKETSYTREAETNRLSLTLS